MLRNEFCTVLDATYLPRALVLFRSLAAVCDHLRLRVFCLDEPTRRLLELLAPPGVTPLGFEELEAHDERLVAVKKTRSPVEYMWTAAPAACRYVLEREPRTESITYLDSDLRFFDDPAVLLEELGDGSVLIVPHRYAARYSGLEKLSGIYNVPFTTFRRTDTGLRVLERWHEQCLDWCYNRHEGGRFSNQKYLDEWPERFPGVRVLRHPGGGLAPWNASDHSIEVREGGAISVDGRPLVFYHYHSFRLFLGVTTLRRLGILRGTYRFTPGALPIVWSTDYELTEAELRLIWEPYVAELATELARVRSLEPRFAAGFTRVGRRNAALSLARELLPRRVRSGLRRALELVR